MTMTIILVLLAGSLVMSLYSAFRGWLSAVPTIAVLVGVAVISFRALERLPIASPVQLYLGLAMSLFATALALMMALSWLWKLWKSSR